MNLRIFFKVFLLLSPSYLNLVFANELPTEPILRLETGMHTAVIRRIATDAQGRWLATASDDKTLRLWDLETGALLKTLRPPIGAGNEGKLYAVAFDPHGHWLATGGWTQTGFRGKGHHNIYVFDRDVGTIQQRLTGLNNVIADLCVSDDGQWLAATLWGTNGVRVWSTKNWQLVFEDSDYAGSSYSCDFASDNRLITSSYAGKLRLYQLSDDSFVLRTKTNTMEGQSPYTVAFNPTGTHIAVGFGRTPAISRAIALHQKNILISIG